MQQFESSGEGNEIVFAMGWNEKVFFENLLKHFSKFDTNFPIKFFLKKLHNSILKTANSPQTA